MAPASRSAAVPGPRWSRGQGAPGPASPLPAPPPAHILLPKFRFSILPLKPLGEQKRNPRPGRDRSPGPWGRDRSPRDLLPGLELSEEKLSSTTGAGIALFGAVSSSCRAATARLTAQEFTGSLRGVTAESSGQRVVERHRAMMGDRTPGVAPGCGGFPAGILGMGSAMGTWLLLLVLLVAAPAEAAAPRHRPVLPDTAGSGDGDEASATLPAQPVTPRISPTVGAAPGTTVTNSSAPGVLDGLVDFFKEYLLLVVVVGSLSFVLLFIICAAVIVRQKHKASAYYPSSFPKKKYVDERDKSGGARDFSEVPDKAPEASAEEPLDGSCQLQADILAAAQNLKSPHKAPLANAAHGD
ncbi:transmembrane protein 119 [Melozone crissalis]|uniref:transmembrane protein 119 n=1 Tax=Melozone crissalis TaxID=40204 RepID=UPI0023DB8B64|nr:transmembrane protein 119 [Melozone crissalis]